MHNLLPEPPYPRDTRSKGWRLEIDHERLLQSDTWALSPAAMRPWLLMLWMIAWQQNPCGSLPDSDELIAARLGMPLCEFDSQRDILIRGWSKHSDGRLYHKVVTERVLEMLKAREREARRKAGYRAKLKVNFPVPEMSHGTPAGLLQESSQSHGTSTSTCTCTSIENTCRSSIGGSAEDSFAIFWQQYPKKVGKQDAERAWRKIKPDANTKELILSALAIQKASPDWQKENGKYIPHPATWLNGHRWEDETTPPSPSSQPSNSIFAGAI